MQVYIKFDGLTPEISLIVPISSVLRRTVGVGVDWRYSSLTRRYILPSKIVMTSEMRSPDSGGR